MSGPIKGQWRATKISASHDVGLFRYDGRKWIEIKDFYSSWNYMYLDYVRRIAAKHNRDLRAAIRAERNRKPCTT